jgi:hypothetical protein
VKYVSGFPFESLQLRFFLQRKHIPGKLKASEAIFFT